MTPGHYRYEATITVILAADGLDEAHRMERQIVDVVKDHTNERVESVTGKVKHRPDLDGSLRL